MISCKKVMCGCGNHDKIKFDQSVDLNKGDIWSVKSLLKNSIINYEDLPRSFTLDKIYVRKTRTAIRYFIKPKP